LASTNILLLISKEYGQKAVNAVEQVKAASSALNVVINMEGKSRSVEKIVLQLFILTQKNILLKKKVQQGNQQMEEEIAPQMNIESVIDNP